MLNLYSYYKFLSNDTLYSIYTYIYRFIVDLQDKDYVTQATSMHCITYNVLLHNKFLAIKNVKLKSDIVLYDSNNYIFPWFNVKDLFILLSGRKKSVIT